MVVYSKKRKIFLFKKKIKRILFIFVLPFLTIFLLSVLLFNLSFFNIKNIKVDGLKFVSEYKIKKNINDILSEKQILFYSKNNFLFLPVREIEKKIKEKNQRIKSIKIVRENFLQDLVVKIDEKKTEYIYCNDGERCFCVDGNSEIFALFSEEKTTRKKEDLIVLKGLKYNNNYVFAQKEFVKIKEFINFLKNKKLAIETVEKKDGLYIFTLTNKTKILFSVMQDYQKVKDNFGKILNKNNFKIDLKKQKFQQNIAYINLSFGKKIFYCMKGDVCENNY